MIADFFVNSLSSFLATHMIQSGIARTGPKSNIKIHDCHRASTCLYLSLFYLYIFNAISLYGAFFFEYIYISLNRLRILYNDLYLIYIIYIYILVLSIIYFLI